MEEHQLIHHEECDVCHEAFILESMLKTHECIPSTEHPHNCDMCNKSFSNKSVLKAHLRIHNGEHPYECGVCNRSFSKSNLKKQFILGSVHFCVMCLISHSIVGEF